MSDVFRKNYKKLDESQIALMNGIKDLAESLHKCFIEAPNADQRMMALAKTNLEQSIMWAVKSIT